MPCHAMLCQAMPRCFIICLDVMSNDPLSAEVSRALGPEAVDLDFGHTPGDQPTSTTVPCLKVLRGFWARPGVTHLSTWSDTGAQFMAQFPWNIQALWVPKLQTKCMYCPRSPGDFITFAMSFSEPSSEDSEGMWMLLLALEIPKSTPTVTAFTCSEDAVLEGELNLLHSSGAQLHLTGIFSGEMGKLQLQQRISVVDVWGDIVRNILHCSALASDSTGAFLVVLSVPLATECCHVMCFRM